MKSETFEKKDEINCSYQFKSPISGVFRKLQPERVRERKCLNFNFFGCDFSSRLQAEREAIQIELPNFRMESAW